MDFVPDYDAGLFVAPRGMPQQILGKLEWWKQAQPKEPSMHRPWRTRHHGSQTIPGHQVLNLVGEPGIGKTWLLRHLAEDDQHLAALAVYLNLEERVRFSNPEEYVKLVEERIRQSSGGSRILLLLDAVPPYLDDHLRILEDAILKPYTMRPGSLAIMALVHPSHICWRTPALRGGEHCLLSPFDESRTREQLRRLQKAEMASNGVDPSQIQESSGGLPLLNYLLATRDSVESFVLLLEYWLSHVPPDKRPRVQSYLEAVCTLDVLDISRIQQALDLYTRHRADRMGHPVSAGNVRNLLQKYSLARSKPGLPGYIVLSEGVRRAASEVLKARDADLYAALQRVA
jgi:hypothetical protein